MTRSVSWCDHKPFISILESIAAREYSDLEMPGRAASQVDITRGSLILALAVFAAQSLVQRGKRSGGSADHTVAFCVIFTSTKVPPFFFALIGTLIAT